MVLFEVKKQEQTPVYLQIIRNFISLIDKNTLNKGDKFPPSRQLAQKLGLNRSTVYRAYRELIALGYAQSMPGSYMTVRHRPELVNEKHRSEKGILSWGKIVKPEGNVIREHYLKFKPEYNKENSKSIIDLSALDFDHRLYPVNQFRSCMNQVLVNNGEKVLQYGQAQGYLPLRECIARRLQLHGITVDADEILITNGSQQAINLILGLLTKPGCKIAIESPTYAQILVLMKYYQAGAIEVPMLNDGIDMDYLEDRLKHQVPSFIYTIPNFQNPTGITSTQSKREALLDLAEKYHIPVVEDGFEEEMKYFGKAILPIKSMDKNQVVLYLGTLSKVLFPGVRIGWVAAEKDCIEYLTAIKRFSELTSSTVLQAAITEFFKQGYYDLHIKRAQRMFRKRMQIALKTIKEYFPEEVSCTRPDGGYTMWVMLKKPYQDHQQVQEILLKNGVIVSPGEYYFHSDNPKKYFRISISSLNEEEIEEGLIRLSKALKEMIERG
jgi:DNA-binding transcriptional MocR family regulator